MGSGRRPTSSGDWELAIVPALLRHWLLVSQLLLGLEVIQPTWRTPGAPWKTTPLLLLQMLSPPSKAKHDRELLPFLQLAPHCEDLSSPPYFSSFLSLTKLCMEVEASINNYHHGQGHRPETWENRPWAT
jgi:hypothetical protein